MKPENDNNGQQNVVNLNKQVAMMSVNVPVGILDITILGYRPDGTLFFVTECADLSAVATLLSDADEMVERQFDDL